jgi:hypothetical protein
MQADNKVNIKTPTLDIRLQIIDNDWFKYGFKLTLMVDKRFRQGDKNI